ncbi:MAG: FtsX-like permease family protein, partial [Bacteroidota bacterium]
CTARASRRVKEVGIKKVVGAKRTTLIAQYLSESVLMALFALFVALLLVLLLLPHFNFIADKELSLQFDVSRLLAMIVIVSFTGLVAGSYPALYLSSFEPSTILKGGFRNVAGAAFARKALVVFQFALSIMLMVSVWVIYDQLDFMQSHHLGYDKEHVILFKQEGVLREEEKLETFISEVERIPGIVNVSSSQHDMIGHHYGTGVLWPGKSPVDNIEFEQMSVNYQMIETLGIKVQSGRTFSRDFGTDNTAIIFNQTAIDWMGLSDPIGKIVKLNGREKTIIGVVQDFHFDSFREEIKPLFFQLAPSATNKIVMKVEAGREEVVLSDLKGLHQRFNPNYVLDYWFLDEDHQSLYAAEARMSTLSKYFGGLAIVISCLGLFGLAAFTAERRMKEIGIRKILGSSEMSIISLLSSEFMKTLAVAILISLPISYVIAKNWLDDFAYKIDLQWWHFFGAASIALIVALFTAGLQTVKVAMLNPTQYLKDE